MYNDKNQTGYEQLRFKENKCRKISIQMYIHILFIFWLYLMPKMAGKDLVNIEFWIEKATCILNIYSMSSNSCHD